MPHEQPSQAGGRDFGWQSAHGLACDAPTWACTVRPPPPAASAGARADSDPRFAVNPAKAGTRRSETFLSPREGSGTLQTVLCGECDFQGPGSPWPVQIRSLVHFFSGSEAPYFFPSPLREPHPGSRDHPRLWGACDTLGPGTEEPWGSAGFALS